MKTYQFNIILASLGFPPVSNHGRRDMNNPGVLPFPEKEECYHTYDDHYSVCDTCGAERDIGTLIDSAMDRMEDR